MLDSPENSSAEIAFFVCVGCAIGAFILFRRKSKKWKLKWDAEAYLDFRERMRATPEGTRRLEKLRRGLLWAPSLCAAFVLFFQPLASRTIFSARHLVPHYQFSVPLNWMIVKSRYDLFTWTAFNNEGALRYGFTPIWMNRTYRSGAVFGWTDFRTPYEWWKPRHEMESGKRTDIAAPSFTIGRLKVQCWEYTTRYRDPEPLKDIVCATEPNGVDFNFHASFWGHEQDKKDFYDVLRSARPDP